MLKFSFLVSLILPAHSVIMYGPTLLQAGGANLQIEFTGVEPDLAKSCIIANISKSAQAVAAFYGRFPVSSARILIAVVAGEQGVLKGTTWGSRDGFPAVTRLIIGQHTTQRDFDAAWIVTHELTHMALPSLPDSQHWLEEGIATYVEPMVRAQAGELDPERVWSDMLAGMGRGEPGASDRGLDHTHTWGRTYWGGALFCLVADVEIRRQTNNPYGLQDALRAIVASGGAIDKNWQLARVLAVGDRATHTSVLQDLYSKWRDTPVRVDLPLLWNQLGVRQEDNHIVFDDAAPLSRVRIGMTAPRGRLKIPPQKHDCL
jgi:predicted metalloprotease with PDZ domain